MDRGLILMYLVSLHKAGKRKGAHYDGTLPQPMSQDDLHTPFLNLMAFFEHLLPPLSSYACSECSTV
jgi:hypothetical protein